jgi:hypothetical protein
MKRYKGISGNAGVTAFSEGKDFIMIQFQDGSLYLYDYNVPGREEVEQMKRLAKTGKGLTTFINQHVRGKYASRLK